LHVLLADPAADFAAGGLENLYLNRAHLHWGVWSIFVTMWVVFEILIVYHGIRSYAALRRLLGAADG
jgi:hypothetical protein